MKSYRLALLLVVVAAGPAGAATTITGGNIINQTWTPAGSPYVVQGDIIIPSGSTLTIEAGTTIQLPTGDMQGSGLSTTQTEITVHGTLAVHGTQAAPVTFGGTSTSSWYGIVIDTTATGIVLDHAIVTNAYSGVTYAAPGNVISSFGLQIEDSASIGLYVTAGSPAFDGLIVTHSGSYNVRVASSGSLTLTNCIVTNAPSGYGVLIGTTSASTLDVINCTIDHNNYGIRNVNASLSTVTVTNSIVTSGTYGIYGTATVTYSDVWGNTSDYVSGQAGTGCVSANPQYMASDDFHLQPTSVAIDSGTTGPDHDIEDHVRPVDGDGINSAEWDMGAYEAGSTMTPPDTDAGVPDDALLGDDARGSDPAAGDAGYGDQQPSGGGCCDAGKHGQGELVWAAIVAIALARRRRRGTIPG